MAYVLVHDAGDSVTVAGHWTSPPCFEGERVGALLVEITRFFWLKYDRLDLKYNDACNSVDDKKLINATTTFMFLHVQVYKTAVFVNTLTL